jgi:hypothetical protein
MALELSEGERAALVELLRETIAGDRFPLSPRIKTLKAVLVKMAPPAPQPEPFPPVKPSERPSLLLRKKRRR